MATDTVEYSLDPWNTAEIETDGTGDFKTGVVEVISDRGQDSGIAGTEVFEILGSFVSVNNSPPRNWQLAYVSFTGDENTGLAIYNPDRVNPVTVTLILFSSMGEDLASIEVEMAPIRIAGKSFVLGTDTYFGHLFRVYRLFANSNYNPPRNKA